MKLVFNGGFDTTLFDNLTTSRRYGGAPVYSIYNGMFKFTQPTANNYTVITMNDGEILGKKSFSITLEGNMNPGNSGTEWVFFGALFLSPEGSVGNGGPYWIGIQRKWTGSVYEADVSTEYYAPGTPIEVGWNVNDGAQGDVKQYTINYEINSSLQNNGKIISSITVDWYINGVLQYLTNFGPSVDFTYVSGQAGIPLCIGPILGVKTDVSPSAFMAIKKLVTRSRKITTNGELDDL